MYASGNGSKIFAILALINKPQQITDFYQANVSNGNLPLRRSVIGKYPRHAFHDRTILPFTEYDPSPGKRGVLGTYKARIHPSHHGLLGVDGSDNVVIKAMGHKKEDFSQRTETYEALWFTPGLVEPLATFTFQGGDYLILPWADGGSLADLWAANPMPQKITPELCRWTSSQFEELVRAISMSTQLGPAAAEMGITGPGQYGNLQPEDILCFRREVSCGGVTDFDLRILNIRATTPHDQAAAAWSAPYSPPDFGIGSLTPRASDYWALGCIYLEFTTWLLLGYKAVEEFTKARRMDYGDGSTLNEMFFFLSRRYRGGLCPKVKPVVTQL
ncbi:hypothetical protein GGTG_05214 [Gaeumannomyces tritici R3-111a-1]|uniref:Protein kinase domain-containing protein n=1 Tax=Gaeumannomyces tritici (strain R3-111a-1) TaxID=644352 RepID=J3NVA1_GAET3|nr:hypothetical protein GGTG_05214 [Gaeumannomyces tritici R3-111a-1]EJT75277.1 hypothetical protein GGTG_05214 [Gaeumannomyces tritici R3-111a-1]